MLTMTVDTVIAVMLVKARSRVYDEIIRSLLSSLEGNKHKANSYNKLPRKSRYNGSPKHFHPAHREARLQHS